MKSAKLVAPRGESVLLVRRRRDRTWTFPGGKRKSRKEEPDQCLRRELAEELPGLELNRYFLWTKVKGKTSQSRKKMNDAVFLGQVDGKLTIGDPKEIDKAAWRKPWRLRLTATSRYIRDRLLQEGHIKR